MLRLLYITVLIIASVSNAQPYSLSVKTDAPLLVSGIGLATWGQIRLAQMDGYKQGDFQKKDLLPWDRPFAGTWNAKADLASDVLIGAGALPLVLSITDWRKGVIRGEDVGIQVVMLSEVLALQSGFSLLARSTELWPRPFMLGSKGGSERESNSTSGSFYSGHTSAAFSIAVFSGCWFDEVHPNSKWSPWLWTGALGTASTMAVLRVAAGKHYPSDVIVGAITGGVIGWGVPFLHRTGSKITMAPQPGGAIVRVAI